METNLPSNSTDPMPNASLWGGVLWTGNDINEKGELIATPFLLKSNSFFGMSIWLKNSFFVIPCPWQKINVPLDEIHAVFDGKSPM